MTKILNILPIIFIVLLIFFLATSVFIGIGYVISLILPLTLFQASVLCIGATFVLGFIILGVVIYDFLFGSGERFSHYDDFGEDEYEDEEYEYEDEEYDDDEEEILDTVVLKPPTVARSGKVSRNAPCPCGSGKKYKNCCGKTQ